MWLSKEVNKLKKKLVKMFSPPEILNTLLFLFCSLFLLSECSIINDPRSTIICMPGDTIHNVTLTHGINAGVFTAIDWAKTMPQCIRESCNRKAGQIAFLVESSCYMVSCFRKEYCKSFSDSMPNTLRVAVTPYTFFDAAPAFQPLERTLYIDENNKVGKKLIDIFAYAKSRRSDNATVFFNITRGNIANAFKLIQRPERGGASLVANVVLDRENVSYYYLIIQATNVDEQKISTTTLRVEVLDINDNGPKFLKSQYSTTINSNVSIGTEVLRVYAVDPDTGENAQIRYYLITYTQLFQILPETGTIIVKQRIQLDRTRTFTLIVAAINGEHRAVVSVNVQVVALNEFRPFFQRLNYQVSVSEAIKVGTSLIRISATDSDTGSFSQLKYSITSGNNNLFRIDDSGDVRTTKSLHSIGVKNFTLRISVRDSGNPPLKSVQSAKLVVLVTSMERYKVKFDVPLYTIAIMENIPVGSSILNVRAVSGLSASRPGRQKENRKGRIVYSIENKDGAPFFRISKHTGAISTRRPFDYELQKEFRLTVNAKDIEARRRGLRVQKDHAIVRVKVIDLNDNRPKFVLSFYQDIINENMTVGSSILRVTANDADNGMNKKVEYIMQSGNINNTFSMDADSGTLRLSRSLAQGTIEFYNLTVFAKDKGRPPLSSSPVSIYIKVKRHTFGPTIRPEFTVPVYLAKVNESCPVHTEILRVRARMNSGPDSGIKYYATQVSGGEADSHFAVNSVTGAITLIRKLDYKKKDRYTFLVAAIDVSKASSVDNVLVRILVEDVNNHKPVFDKPVYNVIYNKEPQLFSRVVQVTATDEDAGQNADLTYFLHDNAKDKKGFFEIEPKTGIMKIMRMLQRESLSLFRMSVSVIDNGTPSLRSDKNAEINVLIFQPFSTPLILIKTTQQTITVQFNLKYLDLTNVKEFGVIVQEYLPSSDLFEDYTKLKPTTWFLIGYLQKKNQNLRRYISKIVPNTPVITKFGMFQITVGDDKGCNLRNEICSGPLNPSSKYRFQLRAYLNDSGPFAQHKFKDGDFTEAFFTGLGTEAKTYRKEGRRNYDAVVYSVGAALILVILLSFLRGFYRLKLDRLRIHEDKKKQISFPVSNPRFQDPESPVEKIRTPGQGRKLMASINAEKSLDIGRSEEDDGSSPDSALDESTRPLQRQRPRLQDIRLKSYFHSVDTESCNSCDGVKVYYVQESNA
ncbi:protocadherin Fat 4-like isoform X2 [Actinia tenebrosa]|uniref:Protocadherin Fat 4-like isoform X2 n=1 Tax=Actinia tenebrosa TaxID=6105 RepID=A0A6P8IKQ2_ACTTE|nr:protocadherin Fat 4-like isoform X2 [Actinia tenebrosa]